MKKSLLFVAIAATLTAQAETVDLTGQYEEELRQLIEPMPTGWYRQASMAKRGIRQEGCSVDDGAVLCHYQTGKSYDVYTQKGMVTDVQLGPGEYLQDGITLGDTVRWSVNIAVTGEGLAQRQHLFIIPKRKRIYTNLLIPTNKRIYEINLSSAKSFRDRSIAWSYPAPLANEKQQNQGIDLASLQTNYIIKPQNGYYWEPRAVYNTESKTYIVFNKDVTFREMPVFYVADSGELNLVNYRVKSSKDNEKIFVVDRLFDHGVIKINKDEDDAIHIYRQGTEPKKRRRIQIGHRREISIYDTIGNR